MFIPEINLYNFRDLGGYRLKNGGVTKYGAIARSNLPMSVTDEELADLREKGFTTILDLRTPEETETYVHAARDKEGFVYLNCPVDDHWRDPFYTPYESALYYMMLMEYRDNVRTVLAAISDCKTGIFFNCHAGKDRTGITAALCLLIAGVCDEDIIADYYKTYIARWGDTDHTTLTMEQHRLLPLAENMELFLAMFRARYTTVENYCHIIGLTDDRIKAIHDKLA